MTEVLTKIASAAVIIFFLLVIYPFFASMIFGAAWDVHPIKLLLQWLGGVA